MIWQQRKKEQLKEKRLRKKLKEDKFLFSFFLFLKYN